MKIENQFIRSCQSLWKSASLSLGRWLPFIFAGYAYFGIAALLLICRLQVRLSQEILAVLLLHSMGYLLLGALAMKGGRDFLYRLGVTVWFLCTGSLIFISSLKLHVP